MVHQLTLEKVCQDAENQNVLRSTVHAVILCGKQKLALHGKHKTGNVMLQDIQLNDGNFCAFLRFHT